MIEGAEVLQVRALSDPAECTGPERQRLAAVRERPTKACWAIAALRPEGFIGIVEYVRSESDALASLIVVTNDSVMPIDFPAKYRRGSQDLWRAGDGGEFSPIGFRVRFIIRRADTYLIAVEWGAEEGNVLMLYAWQPGVPARQVINDYWYRAPR